MKKHKDARAALGRAREISRERNLELMAAAIAFAASEGEDMPGAFDALAAAAKRQVNAVHAVGRAQKRVDEFVDAAPRKAS